MARQADPKSTPRIPLTKERVLRAAIDLADKGGIESLTMRKIGQELGVEAMSLYNHVANKDEILDGIVDVIVGEFDAPSDGADWKSATRQRAISAHEVLLRHPWAPNLMLSRPRVGPALPRLRYVEWVFGSLREGGFSSEMVRDAFRTLDSYLLGFTLQELNLPIHTQDLAEEAASFLQEIPADQYPHITAVFTEAGQEFEFEFGLDLILDGLERARETTA